MQHPHPQLAKFSQFPNLPCHAAPEATGIWLACWTVEEIAEAVGCGQATVINVILSISEGLPELIKPAANRRAGRSELGSTYGDHE